MAESSRIEELRRRVQLDPASIAFAALAEEYRRAGRYDESIAVCRAGLQRHPAYISARVTLGRSLLELGRYEEAREQLEHVLRVAPENLAAIRGLAEIHHRTGEMAYDSGPHEGASPHPASGAATVEAPPAEAAAPPAAATEVATGRGAAVGPAPVPEAAPAPVPLRPVPVQLSKIADAVPERTAAPSIAEPSNAPKPEARQQVTPIPVATRAPESAPVPAPVAPVARRVPHPDEAALPGLEAFLAAIIRARDVDASGGSPRR